MDIGRRYGYKKSIYGDDGAINASAGGVPPEAVQPYRSSFSIFSSGCKQPNFSTFPRAVLRSRNSPAKLQKKIYPTKFPAQFPIPAPAHRAPKITPPFAIFFDLRSPQIGPADRAQIF